MATRIHPSETYRPTTSRGEVKVYEALVRHLPQGWQAWHSLKLDTGSYLEAEADFVVASPEHGFIVIEVKSGAIKVEDWKQRFRKGRFPPEYRAHGLEISTGV